ncbi:hypothetical protein SASPL_126319 [Salvia splendens]|uniref:C2H2-type domain-containing protein n=1 Tax=Salvia splendens TaxID=180675 RepID=A0A8X8XH01_SALSN|nr:zinc finger protein 8-like [Salvia splendens]KAG6413605.1 hypothetical protein SASPL_126319 [Salvia splendens]
MDKASERETRDFMSVESFSQLPFIRSAPRDKAAGGIRLFGQELGTKKTPKDDPSDSNDDENNINSTEDSEASNGGGSSSRKFECHYCCRNFPTSQALGGHQNAHKRERQQAKRAHLQSAMLHGSLADSHVYGLMNYSRLGSAPPLPVAYHSWGGGGGAASSSAYTATSRIYGSYANTAAQSQQQPITCSPLAFWRVPAAAPVAFAGRSQQTPQTPLKMRALPSSISSIPASQLRFGYESKAQMQEHVSLDLHL